MLTPQEVAEHAFAKASFGGYNMAMVDEFLDLLTADYTALYKENAALKSKMKVLADKVEEYRATEDAMRKALLSAQKMADQMVSEAEGQKALILADAENQAKAKLAGIRQELDSEQLRLTAAQNATSAYITKIRELCRSEMEYLAGLSKLTAPAPKADPISQAATATAAAVEKAVEEEAAPAPAPAPAPEPQEPPMPPLEGDSLYQELLRGPVRPEEAPAAPAEPAAPAPAPKAEEEEEDDEPTRRMDFDHLKFGKDYHIE